MQYMWHSLVKLSSVFLEWQTRGTAYTQLASETVRVRQRA